jgi:hypothetical protein
MVCYYEHGNEHSGSKIRENFERRSASQRMNLLCGDGNFWLNSVTINEFTVKMQV